MSLKPNASISYNFNPQCDDDDIVSAPKHVVDFVTESTAKTGDSSFDEHFAKFEECKRKEKEGVAEKAFRDEKGERKGTEDCVLGGNCLKLCVLAFFFRATFPLARKKKRVIRSNELTA